jgi:isocitrate dehydrogenase (NAD+)
MSHRVVFIQGGGVGLDQEAAVRRLFEALGVRVDFAVHLAGRASLDAGREALPTDLFDVVRSTGVALKTRLHQPVGAGPGGPANYNVEFRRRLGLYCSVRPVRNLAGLPSRFTGVDTLLVREISEDLYATGEHEVVPGVVQSFKIVTEAACLRFFRFAFELARRHGRRSIHCIHKANILKLADGLFLDCFRRVAADHPAITPRELIVDNACMQLVSRPHQFEVIAAGNLYGDLLSDLGAGIVGGPSATAAVNHGDGVRVYEAVSGAKPEHSGPDRVNPLPLLLPAMELLKDLSEAAAADRLLQAIGAVLTAGSPRPADLGGTAGTREFTEAIAARLD